MRYCIRNANFDIILVFSPAILVYIQAEELRKFLWAKNVPAKVYVGMRYWHPFTEEAIEQVFFWF
jgi:protoheme ferro-lyase